MNTCGASLCVHKSRICENISSVTACDISAQTVLLAKHDGIVSSLTSPVFTGEVSFIAKTKQKKSSPWVGVCIQDSLAT